MPVFDPVVFDLSIFDATSAVPLLRNVIIEPEFNIVKASSNVTVTIHIQSAETTFRRRFNLNPDTSVEVRLLNPDGTENLAFTTMPNRTLGIYFYTFSMAVDSQVGVYTGQFKAVNGDKTLLSKPMALFEVV